MPRDVNDTGFVLWLTGLSGSGKTTIALVLEEQLKAAGKRVQVLDGDEIRKGLSPEIGFSKEDRERHNRRVIFLAGMLLRHDVVSIIPLISPYREVRDEARQRLGTFVEVFVDATLDTCIKRDPKGLYKKALAGQITDMTGIQDPYEPPLDPEVVVTTDDETPAANAGKILDYLRRRGWLGPAA
jgi:adenylylsulfate kinase